MPVHDWTRVDAGLFHAFHFYWIGSLCVFLNRGGLPPEYYALPEQKIRGPVPDVLTLRLDLSRGSTAEASAAVAISDAPPRTRLVQVSERNVFTKKANRIAVRHRHGQIVAVIEIVSPGNKGSTAEFRALVSKVGDLIQQGINVLIIDVFPPTKRDPGGIHQAIWEEFEEDAEMSPPDKPLTVVSYSAGEIRTAYVEPIAVGDPLPLMPLFLDTEIYVPVALEETYRAAWDHFPAVLKGLLESSDPAEGQPPRT